MSELTPAELNILGLIAGVPSTSPPPIDLNELADAVPPLRTDGPTLAEYVAAGYQPESYPPSGYAEREPEPADNSDLIAQPVETVTEVSGATSWRACTGPDVQAMVKAHAAGFVRTPGFSRDDVMAFLGSKGL